MTMKKHKSEEARPLPIADLPRGTARPRLVVFDLDNTLWTPELYQLKRFPKAERDIWLFQGTRAALNELSSGRPEWADTKVALDSRTGQVEWAKELLSKFELSPASTLNDLSSGLQQIFSGSKRAHYERLKADSGIPFSEMIFCDDSTMNTCEIERMGVLCVLVSARAVDLGSGLATFR